MLAAAAGPSRALHRCLPRARPTPLLRLPPPPPPRHPARPRCAHTAPPSPPAPPRKAAAPPNLRGGIGEIAEAIDSSKMERELQALQQRLRAEAGEAKQIFESWRRKYTAVLLGVGGILGGAFLAFCGSYYVRNNPDIIDAGVAWLARAEFDAATSYEARKRVYMGLPEPQISFSALEARILASLTDEAQGAAATPESGPESAPGSGARAAQAWAKMTNAAFQAVDRSWLLATKAEMRRELVAEIIAADDEAVAKKAAAVAEAAAATAAAVTTAAAAGENFGWNSRRFSTVFLDEIRVF